MADYLVTDTELTSVANAIRTKGGTGARLSFPTEFISAIDAIPRAKNLEFVQILDDEEIALADTLYASWTPSTTAKKIVDTETATTFVADMSTYEYLLKWETSFEAVLNSGATKKAQLIWEGADQYQLLCKRPSSLANIQSENFNGNVCFTYYTVPFMRYYNTSGTATYTHSISYGIYPALTASTFSNSTSGNPTVTVKTPTINARCHNSYFATARASELDQANSKVKLVGKLYRFEKTGAIRDMYDDFYKRYNSL
jgi:hypothetical protein